jgi:hypothetical protein
VKMIVEMEDQMDRLRHRLQALDHELRQARVRMERELDRLHRDYVRQRRGEIVRLSEVMAAGLSGGATSQGARARAERAQVEASPGADRGTDRSREEAGRRGPIAVGPGAS